MSVDSLTDSSVLAPPIVSISRVSFLFNRASQPAEQRQPAARAAVLLTAVSSFAPSSYHCYPS